MENPASNHFGFLESALYVTAVSLVKLTISFNQCLASLYNTAKV